MNQVLEQYLKCFINYHQDNWVDLLLVAEFPYNNTFQESIHQTPFFANYGYHPRFDSLNLSLAKNSAVQDLVTRLLEIHKDMKARLVEAQEWQKRNADKSRKQNPNISIGDKIRLLRRNLKICRLNDKLDYRRLGPFRVSKQVNEVAYRLDLPSSMKNHPVFHVSLLEPYRESTIRGRLPAPPPPIEINGEEEFEVSKIIDSRINRRRLEYLIHWQSYEVSERTWEPTANLANTPKMIKKISSSIPDKTECQRYLNPTRLDQHQHQIRL